MSVEHDPGCPVIGAHSDAARHASDAVNLHISAIGFDAVGKWVAVALSDGKSDGTLYDSKRDAVRHQADEQLCAYVRIAPNGMSPCSAESFLATHRKMYRSGFRLADPDAPHGGLDMVPRLTREDQRRQVAALLR